jgi:hypothetical protein
MPTNPFRRSPRRVTIVVDPILVQGAYYVASGLWPVVGLASFYLVTGPKREGWLVRTFGLLVAAIGFVLLRARRPGDRHVARRVATASGVALAAADTAFVLRGRIRPVYLVDAAAEAALVLAHVAEAHSTRAARRQGGAA